ERRMREDRERVPGLGEHLDDAACQAVLALGPLIGVGVRPHGDEIAGPPPGVELPAEPGHRVHLHHDAALEVAVGVEPQVGVRRAGEAVGAGVAAPPVGVDRVAEPERRASDLVDDPVGADVQELDAAELAPTGLPLEHRLVEQRALRGRLVGSLPAQLRHARHTTGPANSCSARWSGCTVPALADAHPPRHRPASDRMGVMQVGIHLPQYGRVGSPEAITRAARHAEDLGFAGVWVSDHIVHPAAQDYPSPWLYDPIVTLTWAAAVTERIGIGTSVLVVPQHNPLEMANMLASLDNLSGGRLTVGVGVGWSAG